MFDAMIKKSMAVILIGFGLATFGCVERSLPPNAADSGSVNDSRNCSDSGFLLYGGPLFQNHEVRVTEWRFVLGYIADDEQHLVTQDELAGFMDRELIQGSHPVILELRTSDRDKVTISALRPILDAAELAAAHAGLQYGRDVFIAVETRGK